MNKNFKKDDSINRIIKIMQANSERIRKAAMPNEKIWNEINNFNRKLYPYIGVPSDLSSIAKAHTQIMNNSVAINSTIPQYVKNVQNLNGLHTSYNLPTSVLNNFNDVSKIAQQSIGKFSTFIDPINLNQVSTSITNDLTKNINSLNKIAKIAIGNINAFDKSRNSLITADLSKLVQPAVASINNLNSINNLKQITSQNKSLNQIINFQNRSYNLHLSRNKNLYMAYNSLNTIKNSIYNGKIPPSKVPNILSELLDITDKISKEDLDEYVSISKTNIENSIKNWDDVVLERESSYAIEENNENNNFSYFLLNRLKMIIIIIEGLLKINNG